MIFEKGNVLIIYNDGVYTELLTRRQGFMRGPTGTWWVRCRPFTPVSLVALTPRHIHPRPPHPALTYHSLSNRRGGDGASSKSRSSLL